MYSFPSPFITSYSKYVLHCRLQIILGMEVSKMGKMVSLFLFMLTFTNLCVTRLFPSSASKENSLVVFWIHFSFPELTALPPYIFIILCSAGFSLLHFSGFRLCWLSFFTHISTEKVALLVVSVFQNQCIWYIILKAIRWIKAF